MKALLKKEWKKITWEKKQDVIKKTALVAIAASLLGIFITALDAGLAALLTHVM